MVKVCSAASRAGSALPAAAGVWLFECWVELASQRAQFQMTDIGSVPKIFASSINNKTGLLSQRLSMLATHSSPSGCWAPRVLQGTSYRTTGECSTGRQTLLEGL